MRVFDFHHIYKPDHWEWGSKSPNWWGSQAEFAQMTWVKNRASINHTAKLCHLVPGPKTYGRILISSVEKITTKYSCHWTLVYILRSIYFLQSVIYYVFVGYLAALLVYPFVEVFEAVHLVARKSCSDATMLAESTCESLNNTVLPFTLEAKGTEACYFQLRQDFRLTKILSLCKLKTCQVCLGLVKLQFYKSKRQLKPYLCPPSPVWREAAVWTFIWWHGSLALMLPWLSGRKPTSIGWTSTNQIGQTAYQWCAVGW